VQVTSRELFGDDGGVNSRSSAREVAQLAAFSIAAVFYVYVIGWLLTWGRLAAARLPIDVSLPAIDNKTLFATGLRMVVLMAVVFAAMCAVAYLLHAWTWEKHAQDWHDVVRHGRSRARALKPPRPLREKVKLAKPKLAALKPQSRPAGLQEAEIGDPFVRVIAGFDIGVLAAALGLAGGRFVKTLIDQLDPGQWWALLAPWAVISIVLALLLAWIGPLRGGRIVHGAFWVLVVVIALLCFAPVGLLILTWAAIATLGRSYGRRQSRPGSKLEFALSPLPWVLLTIYALVGLSIYATPPVSFSQTIINATRGAQVGGYLARSGAGLYVVSCTPLADATSTKEAVSFIPATKLENVAVRATQFTLDSGYRPSLPTLVLHAFGIDAQTPAWIRPELRSKRPTCAGAPLPHSSVGFEMRSLGAGVIAGPAPPGDRANDGEPPIEQTTPKLAALARRFQPTILVTVADRFWPVSVGAVLHDVGSKGQLTCLHHLPSKCAPGTVELSGLKGPGSSPADYLQYPSTPALDPDPTGQLDAFLRGQQSESRTPLPSLHQWLADPGLLDPWYTAQVYFYYAGAAEPARWPAPNTHIPRGLIALQYWFFYPYNYYPTVATPDLMNEAPIAGDVVNTDLHQGDWEHITVLVERTTLTPRWIYMARHSKEGAYYPWNSPALTFDEGHPIVQAALGGHPTYDAHCGARPRYVEGLNGIVSDWVVCGSGRFAFRAATTPLVDIAKAPWACWKGHFGVATPGEVSAAKHPESSVQRALEKYYEVAGPRSPLWQAENGHLKTEGPPLVDQGVCANGGSPEAPEQAAIRSGIGAAMLPIAQRPPVSLGK
jgi:hypothetical protein